MGVSAYRKRRKFNQNEVERYGVRVLLYYFRDMSVKLERALALDIAGGAGERNTDKLISKGLVWDIIDVTKFVTSVQWSESIHQPYGTITCNLAEELYNLLDVLNDKLGPAWISVQAKETSSTGNKGKRLKKLKKQGYVVLQAGYVVKFYARKDVRADGSITETQTVEAVSYLDFCAQFSLNICTITSDDEGQRRKLRRLLNGTFFSVEDWTEKASSIIKELPGNDVGVAFKLAWSHFARVHVPIGAFIGGWHHGSIMLKDLVTVLTSGAKTSSNNHVAGERTWDRHGKWEAPLIPGFSISALSNAMSFGGSFLGFLQSSFVADPGMVELFPVLANNKVYLIFRLAPFRVLKSSVWADFVYNQDNKDFVATLPMRTMAKEGAVDPLTKRSVMKDAKITGGAGPQMVESEKLVKFNSEDADKFFGKPTWKRSHADHLHLDDCRTVQMVYQDAQRVSTAITATWPTMPDSLAFICGQTGLPVVDDAGLLTQGCRVYRPSWPFIPNVDAATATPADWRAQLAEFSVFIRAIALEAAQYRMNLHFMWKLNIGAIYSPQLRVGRPFAFHKEPGSALLLENTGVNPQRDATTHRTKKLKTLVEYGYTETVSHTISMQGDSFIGTSQIDVDRFLSKKYEHIRYSPISVDMTFRLRFGHILPSPPRKTGK